MSAIRWWGRREWGPPDSHISASPKDFNLATERMEIGSTTIPHYNLSEICWRGRSVGRAGRSVNLTSPQDLSRISRRGSPSSGWDTRPASSPPTSTSWKWWSASEWGMRPATWPPGQQGQQGHMDHRANRATGITRANRATRATGDRLLHRPQPTTTSFHSSAHLLGEIELNYLIYFKYPF